MAVHWEVKRSKCPKLANATSQQPMWESEEIIRSSQIKGTIIAAKVL
jgi:hypothetical protein